MAREYPENGYSTRVSAMLRDKLDLLVIAKDVPRLAKSGEELSNLVFCNEKGAQFKQIDIIFKKVSLIFNKIKI